VLRDLHPPIRFEKHVGAASAPLAAGYRPRRPERTILYRTVHNHLETMLAEAGQRSAHGFGYPRFVERAFRHGLNHAASLLDAATGKAIARQESSTSLLDRLMREELCAQLERRAQLAPKRAAIFPLTTLDSFDLGERRVEKARRFFKDLRKSPERVRKLDLSGKNLRSLPPELFALKNWRSSSSKETPSGRSLRPSRSFRT